MKHPRDYLKEQYRTPSNLNARIALHQRFSRNPYGWYRWVFDHLELPSHCRLLELGCGTGSLWRENSDRIPDGWEILLTDFAEGMLQQAQENLRDIRRIRYQLLDAQSIPYPFQSHCFDGVIANHLLYHLPNRQAVLGEIHRLLKPGGTFFASTVGKRHMCEVAALLARFDPALASWGNVAEGFTLENGQEQLSQQFAQVRQYRYEDQLEVTEAQPLIDYVRSGWAQIPRGKLADLHEYVRREIESHGGVMRISKDSGIFVGQS